MEQCIFCHNNSVENQCCYNCGRILGAFRVAPLKSLNYMMMYVTDKYLIMNASTNLVGNAAATFAGGLVGSTIYDAAKKKADQNKIGMLDLRNVTKIDVYFPSSKAQGGMIHVFFQNGADLLLGVFETGMKKVNLPVLIDALQSLPLNVEVIEVKSLPRMKETNPIVKKSKLLPLTVSQSATAFIQPFKGMIVVD